jgi:hypothetical protein
MIFNERAFLVRCLAGIFFLQFVTVGYLAYSCHTSLKGGSDTDKISLVCNNASNSFNETGKLALATVLALLVPSGKDGENPPAPSAPPTPTRARRKSGMNPDEVEG